MVRKFNIEINKEYGWELDVVGFNEPYENYEPIKEAPLSFGVCVKKDNKIIALYDPFCPRTEAIQETNKLEIFQEECEFVDSLNEYEFKGTFVDALIYIQNWYKEEFADG